jgi:hypothetical protein
MRSREIDECKVGELRSCPVCFKLLIHREWRHFADAAWERALGDCEV